MAVGALNGSLIGHLRIPDMLATLGTMTLVEGINIVLTRGYTLTGFPDFLIAIGNDAWGDIPIPFIIFVVLTILLGVLLNKTSFGYSVYMIGSNYTASKFSAIDTRKVIIKAYMLSSVFAAVTSFIMMGQMNLGESKLCRVVSAGITIWPAFWGHRPQGRLWKAVRPGYRSSFFKWFLPA